MKALAPLLVPAVALPLLAPARPAAAQEPVDTPAEEITGTVDVPSYPKMVLLDVRYVAKAPFRWGSRQWLLFGGWTAAVLGLSLMDERWSGDARASGLDLGFVGSTFEGMGDIRSFGYLGAFWIVGAITKDEKARNVFYDGLSASITSAGIITPIFATLVGRSRPTTEEGAWTFRPFGGRSFPSGHVTQMFAVASVVATSYDSFWVKAAAYGGATVGAWIRVQRGKHFPSDVLAGAIIGTAVGRSVVHYNRELRTKGEAAIDAEPPRLSLVPVVMPGEGTYGFSARLTF